MNKEIIIAVTNENAKFRNALEYIASFEIKDSLNYYNARAMIEKARDALGIKNA